MIFFLLDDCGIRPFWVCEVWMRTGLRLALLGVGGIGEDLDHWEQCMDHLQYRFLAFLHNWKMINLHSLSVPITYHPHWLHTDGNIPPCSSRTAWRKPPSHSHSSSAISAPSPSPVLLQEDEVRSEGLLSLWIFLRWLWPVEWQFDWLLACLFWGSRCIGLGCNLQSLRQAVDHGASILQD